MRLDESFPVVILFFDTINFQGVNIQNTESHFFSVFEKMFLSFRDIKLCMYNEGGFQDGFQEAFIGT